MSANEFLRENYLGVCICTEMETLHRLGSAFQPAAHEAIFAAREVKYICSYIFTESMKKYKWNQNTGMFPCDGFKLEIPELEIILFVLWYGQNISVCFNYLCVSI